jgi:UPF0755 protein
MLKIIVLALCAGIITAVVLVGGFFYDAFIVSPNDGAEPVVFVIEDGWTAGKIAHELAIANIITSPQGFTIYAKITDHISDLQAGTYELLPGMSLHAVIVALTNAQAREVQVTIPEGFTASQIGETVCSVLPGITKESWDEAVGKDGVVALDAPDVLSGIPDGQGLEGYLFPDTYRFRSDADAKTVVGMMYLTLLRRLSENNVIPPTVLEGFEFNNGLTLHEALTLASIVEREVQNPEDMKIVAGIFFTRLKIGMALQADSTVNYLTGKKDASVSLEDSKIDSPYNTYRRIGLPPGPISNPGLNAILAVMNPQDSGNLYFLTTSDGQVVYAKTFDEHVRNKYQYLK